jgi:hypothetical protein
MNVNRNPDGYSIDVLRKFTLRPFDFETAAPTLLDGSAQERLLQVAVFTTVSDQRCEKKRLKMRYLEAKNQFSADFSQ